MRRTVLRGHRGPITKGTSIFRAVLGLTKMRAPCETSDLSMTGERCLVHPHCCLGSRGLPGSLSGVKLGGRSVRRFEQGGLICP